MSAQSGIQPDAALLEAWSQAIADQSLRIFTIKLENEQLVHAGSVQREGTAEEDYALLAGQAQPSTPSYFLFRLDDAAGWLLVIYVPDTAPVRAKMLYASTRASLTRSLGESSFVDSLHAHSTSDLTSAAYRNHLKHSNSSAPLTERERELADLKAAEGVEARGTAPRGGAFSTNEEKGVLRWSEEAQQAARELAETQDGAVHLILDIAAETVTLSSRQTGASLAIPTDSPSYSLIAHAGKFALIYCCPSSSPVKSRMLYSSSVRGVAHRASEYGITIVKRLETSDSTEITPDYFASELGTNEGNAAAQAAPPPTTGFARPKRPGGRAR